MQEPLSSVGLSMPRRLTLVHQILAPHFVPFGRKCSVSHLLWTGKTPVIRFVISLCTKNQPDQTFTHSTSFFFFFFFLFPPIPFPSLPSLPSFLPRSKQVPFTYGPPSHFPRQTPAAADAPSRNSPEYPLPSQGLPSLPIYPTVSYSFYISFYLSGPDPSTRGTGM